MNRTSLPFKVFQLVIETKYFKVIWGFSKMDSLSPRNTCHELHRLYQSYESLTMYVVQSFCLFQLRCCSLPFSVH